MENYKVVIKPSAVKELEKIPKKERSRVTKKISYLGENPRPKGCQKLSGQEKYRIRQGVCRVIYSIEGVIRVVSIVKIAHRREVYR